MVGLEWSDEIKLVNLIQWRTDGSGGQHFQMDGKKAKGRQKCYPLASFLATDRFRTYHSCRSFSSATLTSSWLSTCRRRTFRRSMNRPTVNIFRLRPLS